MLNYLKRFNESTENHTIEKIVDDLKEDLTTISDNREIDIFYFASKLQNPISKPIIYIKCIIDDVINTNQYLSFDSDTNNELKKRHDLIMSILEQVKEGLDRCQIEYDKIDYIIRDLDYDNDADEYNIPQTLFINISGVEVK